MTGISAQQASQIPAVRWWLLSMAALIALMVLVGGATRLTESGLSIVEWKPVTGTLPPLSPEQWTQEFEAYKTIPQYRELNAGMNLDEFKTIFWGMEPPAAQARDQGGLSAAVSLVSLAWRVGRRPEAAVVADFRPRRAAGAVGWWMVASGLSQRTGFRNIGSPPI
jgi:cytochrome c oxidase assembly protein subunit 15